MWRAHTRSLPSGSTDKITCGHLQILSYKLCLQGRMKTERDSIHFYTNLPLFWHFVGLNLSSSFFDPLLAIFMLLKIQKLYIQSTSLTHLATLIFMYHYSILLPPPFHGDIILFFTTELNCLIEFLHYNHRLKWIYFDCKRTNFI